MRLPWIVLILAGAASCSFEGSAGNESAGTADAARASDGAAAAVDADTSSPDRDSDGILDGDDNCPGVANAGQENEDVDAHGNLCDVCPHIADDGQADDDADGVGNACDPQPGVTNAWLYFDGFDAALEANDWVGEAGFTVSAGELHSVNNSGRYYLRNTTFDHGDDVLVGSSVTFNNPLGPNGISYRYGGPLVRAAANSTANGCWIIRSVAEGIEGYAFVESLAGGPAGYSFIASAIVNAAVYDVLVTVNSDAYGCDYQLAAGGTVSLARTTSANSAGGNIGIVSSYVELDARYLFAISLQ